MTTVKKGAVIVGCVLFLSGLLLFAYLGIFNRYWADDWCYNADLKSLGFIGTLKGYTYITAYASNRFSLTFFSGLIYQLGILGVQLMSALAIAACLGGMFWALYNLKKIAKLRIPTMALLFAVAIVVYYSLYTAPHLYQSLYWRSGFLPYLTPLVFSAWIFALITTQSVREKPSAFILVLLAPLAFFAGGFSEAGCAYLATALGLYFVAAWIYRKQPWAARSITSAGLALAFVILAMIFLIISPTSGMRMARYGEPASPAHLPYLILFFTYQFVRLSILDMPLPHLALFITLFLLGFLQGAWFERPVQARFAIFFILIVMGIAFLLIAAGIAPSAYIEQYPPGPRARIIMRVIMLSAIVILAAFSGMVIKQKLDYKLLDWAALILLLFVFIYAARTIAITGQKIELYAHRAMVWDERDQKIRQSIEEGILEVEVRELDSRPVGNINDFKASERFWINNCGERFYGAKAIRANLP